MRSLRLCGEKIVYASSSNIGGVMEVNELADIDSAQKMDWPDLLERVMGNEDLAWRLLDIFIADLPSRIGKLRSAERDKKYKEMQAASHALKGTAANVGAKALQKAALALEKAAQSENADQVAFMLGIVEDHSRKFLEALPERPASEIE
jgi:HPt (histidine-containing phosphotransfer) domain-containing protein